MTERGFWGSRLAFILAASGSAIGLGNIWGFPTRVGQGGGAAFVLIYLVCIFFICAPILIAEIALGRAAGLSPVGAFDSFRPGSKWWHRPVSMDAQKGSRRHRGCGLSAFDPVRACRWRG